MHFVFEPSSANYIAMSPIILTKKYNWAALIRKFESVSRIKSRKVYIRLAIFIIYDLSTS